MKILEIMILLMRTENKGARKKTSVFSGSPTYQIKYMIVRGPS
jgi:hypothetical protein